MDGEEALAEIPLDPLKNRTGDHWHVLVAGLPPIFRYGWRVNGPEGGGHRFNPNNILLDPSSTAIADGSTWSDISGATYYIDDFIISREPAPAIFRAQE